MLDGKQWLPNFVNQYLHIFPLLQIDLAMVHHNDGNNPLSSFNFSYQHCMWNFTGSSECQEPLQIHLLPSYESAIAAFVTASKGATVFVPFRTNGNCTLLDPYCAEAADPC